MTSSAAAGCLDNGDTTEECPLAGNINLTIRGSSFGPYFGSQSFVSVAIIGQVSLVLQECELILLLFAQNQELSCNEASVISHEELRCILVGCHAKYNDSLRCVDCFVLCPAG